MNRKIRFILFLIFAVFFLLTAPQIIFYSMGYRFDFERKKIVNTGGLYLRVFPSGVEVFVDGKLKTKTGPFLNSALIQNLLPKKHQILIKKGGYYPWQKTLEIKKREVAKADNIILIKENSNFNILEKEINDFYFSPSAKIIVFKKITPTGFNLEIFDLKNEQQKKVFSFPKNAQLSDLKWSPDSKRILLTLSPDKYFILNLENIKQTIPQSLKLEKNIQEISFNPLNSQELFFVKNNILYLKNLENEKISSVLKNLIAYEFNKDGIIWFENSGFLYKSDFFGNVMGVLNVKPFSVKKNSAYKIITQPGIIFLKETPSTGSEQASSADSGQILFLLNSKTKILENFYNPVKNIKFSSDSKKILSFNDYEIWFSDLVSAEFEKIFLTRFSEKIDDVFWLNNYYLIFNIGSKIKISEIDTRDGINIVDLAEFEKSKIFWNQNNKRLYILKENTLFVSEKLIP